MYEGDSFYTLSILGRAGLILLSIFLATILVLTLLKIIKRFNLLMNLAFSVFFLWLFVWLSPQIYYTYYMLLFDFLEFKSVLKLPPAPNEILGLLSFTDQANFSNHSKGILGWIMVLMSFWQSYVRKKGFLQK